MTPQLVIVFVVLSSAVGYASYRIWQTLLHVGDPCRGCEGCALKDVKRADKRKRGQCEQRKDRQKKVKS